VRGAGFPRKVRFALDSSLEGAGFEPSVPRETKRFLDGRSCRPRRASESRRGGGPSYATHPVETRREHLCSNYLRHTRALALPTAAHDLAVQFTLLAASGMIGNQRLEHSGEPRGKSFGSDTLGGNAGALA
jgi:hypothetical protein